MQSHADLICIVHRPHYVHVYIIAIATWPSACHYLWIIYFSDATTVPATTVPTTIIPPPPPPLGVQGLCSVVVWHSPVVPCEDIRGYEVRLYHPQSAHLNMTSHVGMNGTFYIIDEEKLVSSDETYVQVAIFQYLILSLCTSYCCMQVRVIHTMGTLGEWSEGISLGKAV